MFVLTDLCVCARHVPRRPDECVRAPETGVMGLGAGNQTGVIMIILVLQKRSQESETVRNLTKDRASEWQSLISKPELCKSERKGQEKQQAWQAQ